MATYTIIGGDNQEYGPITDHDVRQWLAEGRLNAQSLAKGEGDAEFRPLSKFPEFADQFQTTTPGTIAPLLSPRSWDDDYELDIGDCVSRGWGLYKTHFGALFSCFLVAVVIQFAFFACLSMIMQVTGLQKDSTSAIGQVVLGFVFPAVSSLVMGPLYGGLYLVYLRNIRGESAGVSDLFVGFQKSYGQLVMGWLVISLINALCMAPFNYVAAQKTGPALQHFENMQSQHPDPAQLQSAVSQLMAGYGSALPVLLVCLIPLTYLVVCLQFTLPLILDKQLGFGAALKTSLKRVNQHWWLVFGLTVLVGLISVSGAIGCCVGAILTVPIGFAAAMYGYETLFSGRKT
jgi:hypothetical protein